MNTMERGAVKRDERSGAIVLFDGMCNLCNGAVRFIIARDKQRYFRFASLQSACGQRLLQSCEVDKRLLDTIVLVQCNRLYTKSTAALQIVRHLNPPWRLFSVLFIIPKPLRDALYDWIAFNRYRWFGQRDVCLVPTLDIQARFVNEPPHEPQD